MALACPISSSLSCHKPSLPHLRLQLPHRQPSSRLSLLRSIPRHVRLHVHHHQHPPLPLSSGGGDDGDGGGDDGDGDVVNMRVFVVVQTGSKLESLPSDLAAAVEDGRVTWEIIRRFAEMEGSPLLRWLLQFRCFRERLLADVLFLAEQAMECGVGIIAKATAEYEKRSENFVKQIGIVMAGVVAATILKFMLVYLPAPTVSLQPPLARTDGLMADLFHICPDNDFQNALAGAGRSFSLLRVGLDGSLVFQSSKGQSTVLRPSAKTEYLAVANAEANCYRKFDIHFVLSLSFQFNMYQQANNYLM